MDFGALFARVAETQRRRADGTGSEAGPGTGLCSSPVVFGSPIPSSPGLSASASAATLATPVPLPPTSGTSTPGMDTVSSQPGVPEQSELHRLFVSASAASASATSTNSEKNPHATNAINLSRLVHSLASASVPTSVARQSSHAQSSITTLQPIHPIHPIHLVQPIESALNEEEDGEIIEENEDAVTGVALLTPIPSATAASANSLPDSNKTKNKRKGKRAGTVLPAIDTANATPTTAFAKLLKTHVPGKKPPSTYICNVCSLVGVHYFLDCDNPNGAPPDRAYICRVCHEPGHHVKWCPVKQKREGVLETVAAAAKAASEMAGATGSPVDLLLQPIKKKQKKQSASCGHSKIHVSHATLPPKPIISTMKPESNLAAHRSSIPIPPTDSRNSRNDIFNYETGTSDFHSNQAFALNASMYNPVLGLAGSYDSSSTMKESKPYEPSAFTCADVPDLSLGLKFSAPAMLLESASAPQPWTQPPVATVPHPRAQAPVTDEEMYGLLQKEALFQPFARHQPISNFHSQTTPPHVRMQDQVVQQTPPLLHHFFVRKHPQNSQLHHTEQSSNQVSHLDPAQTNDVQRNSSTHLLPKPFCRFFKANKCHAGAKCRFSHDAGSQPCAFLHLHGSCAKGVHCRFSHAPLVEEAVEALREERDSFKARKAMERAAWEERGRGADDEVLKEMFGMDFSGTVTGTGVMMDGEVVGEKVLQAEKRKRDVLDSVKEDGAGRLDMGAWGVL
ncbi:hypothetical protein BC830DRAFT_1133343 [Chytriomyces sp. MP71]|nr:hypothetical protein BC830DRAFT_1133343 [Chytriomyces sp. MP71]